MPPKIVHHDTEPPGPCSYLPDQKASLEQMVMMDVTPEEFEAMLSRGWRRFGPVYFRPACKACSECVTLRIPTATFQPNRSQRRARAACARFRVEVGIPRVDPGAAGALPRVARLAGGGPGLAGLGADAARVLPPVRLPAPVRARGGLVRR